MYGYSKKFMFVVDMSIYDIPDALVNQLEKFEALAIKGIFQMSFVELVTIFFNKCDQLAEKLLVTPFTVAFKDYQGSNTVDSTVSWYFEQFKSVASNQKIVPVKMRSEFVRHLDETQAYTDVMFNRYVVDYYITNYQP